MTLPLNQVLLGDCLEVMKTLPDNSVDSVVTDPPYGLGRVKDLPGLIQAWLSGENGNEYQSKGFMSADWDTVPSPNVWREVFRVLKPGGYALVFAGTRTVDLMGLSLRLAGFEISESLNWVFGQGFPKSKKMLKPAHEPILFCYKPGKRENLNIDECRIGWNGKKSSHGGARTAHFGKNKSDVVEDYQEHPSGRYPADTILSHHPDCVPYGIKRVKGHKIGHRGKGGMWGGLPENKNGGHDYTSPDGIEEIAAYQCADRCVVRLLDEQTAQMSASKNAGNKDGYKRPNDKRHSVYASPGKEGNKGVTIPNYRDADGTANASRFFLNLPPEAPFIYRPKASRNDRTMGGKVNNTHTTVKPVNLMSYLVRLVTPVDSIVLDPFLGSGSTALGCIRENRNYIGIEQEPEYHAIAIQRITTAIEQQAAS